MPASPVTGGKRRIDRVLAPEFSADLQGLSMEELRARRAEVDQEEVDLSYVRRLLQGRLDIASAEVTRRGGDSEASLVESLAAILSEEDRAPARGLGRHRSLEPSRLGDTRRSEESLVAETGLDDPSQLSAEELRDIVARLLEEEAAVSSQRRQVQDVLDALSGEVMRRYRDGSASVSTLLAE